MRKTNIFENMENDIMNADINENEKSKLLKNVMRLKDNKINIMITGATGCGKSSTINALFDTEVAKVGVGVDPETMEIEKYELDNLILWDTPGLGDGKEVDNRHAKNIIHKLAEVDAQGNALIDLVLVILDSGTRDLGTSYELINNVIIPNLGADKEGRILVALNQADMAMKGRNWDKNKNEPNDTLKEFLDKKAASVKNRIFEGTGVNVTPIYYSAGYKEEGEEQSRPYNLSKLLYYIVKATPAEKRAVYVNNINQDENMWKDDDELIDYAKETKRTILQSVMDSASEGADIGGEIGEVFGPAGETVGRVIGTVVGGAAGVVKGIGGGVIDGIKDFFSLW
ncbi:MAG: GTPase family protein [Lachnospira sp.]